MSKKTEKDKLIDIAAKVLSIEPNVIKDALNNALDLSILKRDNEILKQTLLREREEHEKEIKLKEHRCTRCNDKRV